MNGMPEIVLRRTVRLSQVFALLLTICFATGQAAKAGSVVLSGASVLTAGSPYDTVSSGAPSHHEWRHHAVRALDPGDADADDATDDGPGYLLPSVPRIAVSFSPAEPSFPRGEPMSSPRSALRFVGLPRGPPTIG